MRIVFMGTPEFAVPSLRALVNSPHEVAAVVCQPDRERDKKGNIVFSAVKSFAIEKGLKVLQFESIREQADILKSLIPDIMVTAAYGQILSEEILKIPRYGVINVHASLLPKYRGSSPVQHSIINGEDITGITIMQTAAGLDTGDIISAEKVDIFPTDTTGELLQRLSFLGAELLIKTLDDIQAGRATKTPQNEKETTKCSMIKKSDGLVDWNRSALEIRNFIHGMNPWPLAHSYLQHKRLNFYRAEIYEGMIPAKLFCAGEISTVGGSLIVFCGGGGFIKLLEVQTEGKRKMEGSELVKGLRLTAGEGFSDDR